MMLAVTTAVTQLIAAGTGIAAIVGAILAAARWRREDTGMMVNQATALVTGMDSLVIELRRERDEARKERDETRTENLALREEVSGLRSECGALREEVKRLRLTIEARREGGEPL
jgi:uncharacterized coiled-coil DUF342 family protein